MEKEITKHIEACWRDALVGLQVIVDKAINQMRDIVVLEDYYRQGQKAENLKAAFSSFGGNALDFGALSAFVEQAKPSDKVQFLPL